MKLVVQASLWGAAWGLAAGFWLLAPLIVSTHHLTVTTLLQGLPVTAVLAILFAFIGASLGLVIYGIVAVAQRVMGRRFADAKWSITLATGILLVPAYLIAGCIIYVKRFGSGSALAWCIDAFRLGFPAMLAIAVLLLGLHAATSGRLRAHRQQLALLLTVAASLTGAVALLFRLPEVAGPTREARALDELEGTTRERRPLLVVAFDGGEWRPIEPLMQTGKLPTFGSLMKRGLHGDVIALWPPYWSTTAWAAIITGTSREETGVHGNLVVKAPGLPAFQAPLDIDPRLVLVSAIEYALASRRFIRAAPPERSMLKRPPVWEMLEQSGRKTAVIRFNFSHPARNQASIVISNRIVADVWDMLGVDDAGTAGLVWPDSLRTELMRPFSSNWTPPAEELAQIFPHEEWEKPAGAYTDPVPVLRRVLAFDQRTFRSAVDILSAHPDVEVLIVHFGGLDNVQHMFWEYRFPEDFERPPDEKDIAALGPVIDRYIEFIDRGIGEIVRAFPEEPNVMIVSDHGMESVENKPPFKAWHASPGVFFAAGPDFPNLEGRIEVAYDDIVPTILDLQGLTKPENLKGHSLISDEALFSRR